MQQFYLYVLFKLIANCEPDFFGFTENGHRTLYSVVQPTIGKMFDQNEQYKYVLITTYLLGVTYVIGNEITHFKKK